MSRSDIVLLVLAATENVFGGLLPEGGYPLLGTFFLVARLSLARATPLFLEITCQAFVPANILDINSTQKGMVSYAAPKTSPNVLLSVRYRVTCASMTWYDMIVKTRYCSENWRYYTTILT